MRKLEKKTIHKRYLNSGAPLCGGMPVYLKEHDSMGWHLSDDEKEVNCKACVDAPVELPKAAPKPMKAKVFKTYKIRDDLHVGMFEGKMNSGPLKKWVAISEYKDDASMGEWMTLSQARKLRDNLTKILEKADA